MTRRKGLLPYGGERVCGQCGRPGGTRRTMGYYVLQERYCVGKNQPPGVRVGYSYICSGCLETVKADRTLQWLAEADRTTGRSGATLFGQDWAAEEEEGSEQPEQCPGCGTELQEGERVCWNCAALGLRQCRRCREWKQMEDWQAGICMECREKLEQEPEL